MKLLTLQWEKDRRLQRYTIAENDVATIGRRTECTITLTDPKVSRNHARISFFQGRFYVHPLSEQNPLYVNDQRVTPRGTPLSRGDAIKIGDQTLRVGQIEEADGSYASRCPNCNKLNPRQATVCQWCGNNLPEAKTELLR